MSETPKTFRVGDRARWLRGRGYGAVYAVALGDGGLSPGAAALRRSAADPRAASLGLAREAGEDDDALFQRCQSAALDWLQQTMAAEVWKLLYPGLPAPAPPPPATHARPFPARALRPVVQPVGLRILGDTDG